jgi:hypothetical protein
LDSAVIALFSAVVGNAVISADMDHPRVQASLTCSGMEPPSRICLMRLPLRRHPNGDEIAAKNSTSSFARPAKVS